MGWSVSAVASNRLSRVMSEGLAAHNGYDDEDYDEYSD